MTRKLIQYKPTRTGAKLHKSEAFIRCIKGPVGSGKSVTCIQEMKRLWHTQLPNNQGIRLGRWAIIRNTRPELINTTLKTFQQWIPEELAKIKHNPNLKAEVKYKLPDGTTVQVEVLFLALDQPKDVRKLLSLELSGVFINEAREIVYDVVKAARERVGRYPAKIDGYSEEQCNKIECEYTGKITYSACTRKAILMDTNPPNNMHWWYHLDVNGHLPDIGQDQKEQAKFETAGIFAFFNNPPPLMKDKGGSYVPNPKGENIEYLPGGYKYYLDMIAGNSSDHINVMVLGNYGMMKTGRPVYPEYNDILHSEDIKPIPGVPIALGWDFGLNPSLVIGQETANGQVRIYHELTKAGIGARQFARDIVKPFLIENYKGYEIRFSVGDPTGNNRGEGEGTSAISIINEVLGFTTEGAPTNDPTQRLDAVKSRLTRLVEGGKPAYVVDKRCTVLREGKMGGYCYARMNTSGEKYRDKPDKNEFSHLADAEQYLLLGFVHGLDSARSIDDAKYQEPELQGGY